MSLFSLIRPAGPGERVADATAQNWVDRWAPPAWRPYLRLSRADRPIGTWLLLLPCWHGLALACAVDGWGWRDAWFALAFALGAFLMRGAGCSWNDWVDRDFDGRVARTASRPIPSGAVTPRQTLFWIAAQMAVAGLILLTLPPFAMAVTLVSLIFVVIYPFMKRFTWWPQVFLGLAFNWGAWTGWAAHAEALGWAPALLYLAGIAWTLFYDTIYAHQDKEDDALIGVKSTARLLGERSRPALLGFALASAALAGAAAGTVLSGRALALALLGVAAFLADMLDQLRRLDIDDPALCLTLFRRNRRTGLVLLAGLALAAA